MTAKEYLREIRVLDTKISQKEEQIANMRIPAENLMGAIRYDGDHVHVSASGSKVEELVLRYMALMEEVREEKLKYELEKQKRINEIHALNDARYIQILFKRYVEFKSYEMMAVELSYSFDYVKELHRDALETFEKKHPTLSHPGQC